MSPLTVLHFVVPEGYDDPARPSGGNVYDQRVRTGLARRGWQVTEHRIAGTWPVPQPAAAKRLGAALADVPDDELVLVDGLVAAANPQALQSQATRLRLVLLVHMPAAQQHVELSAARAVVTTSNWARERLLRDYELAPERVHAATPGVDRAALAHATEVGAHLMCVAAVTRHKGHDLLVAALSRLRHLPWRCVCVGDCDRDRAFVKEVCRQADWHGITDRFILMGPRAGDDLARAYEAADLLVAPSRTESYGMVVTEALAHGVPVVATDVGGLPEALGRTADGQLPGLLVAPTPGALAAAVESWLTDPAQRRRLRDAARARRDELAGWDVTAARIAAVLTAVKG